MGNNKQPQMTHKRNMLKKLKLNTSEADARHSEVQIQTSLTEEFLMLEAQDHKNKESGETGEDKNMQIQKKNRVESKKKC